MIGFGGSCAVGTVDVEAVGAWLSHPEQHFGAAKKLGKGVMAMNSKDVKELAKSCEVEARGGDGARNLAWVSVGCDGCAGDMGPKSLLLMLLGNLRVTYFSEQTATNISVSKISFLVEQTLLHRRVGLLEVRGLNVGTVQGLSRGDALCSCLEFVSGATGTVIVLSFGN